MKIMPENNGSLDFRADEQTAIERMVAILEGRQVAPIPMLGDMAERWEEQIEPVAPSPSGDSYQKRFEKSRKSDFLHRHRRPHFQTVTHGKRQLT